MTQPAPDLVVTGGSVYTVDPAQPRAEAFAVTHGRISAIGTSTEVAALAGPATVRRDLAGAFVMPGLVDVHNHHFLAGKEDLFELQIPVGATLDSIIEAVRVHAAALPADAWVVGGPWASDRLGDVNTAAALDRLDDAAGGRPVMLTDDSHHNRWASSRALALAGVTAGTEGVLLDGERPTGVLLEAAGIPVAQTQAAAGGLTPAQERAASRRGVEILNAHGVTCFQDAGVSTHILEALRALDTDGELNAWVVSSMLINDEIFGFDRVGEALVFDGEPYRTEHHRPDFVKIFLDGVPPTRTGAFLEPYLPDDVHGAHHHGDTLLDPEELVGWLRRVAQAGLSAKIHCTGDASVHAVLNAVEVIRGEGITDTRYQVAHGQFVHADDVPRFAALGVAADISPFIWVPGPIVEAIREVLPRERADQMQPNRSLLDAGAIVAGGSDWPVSPSPNAWEGIHGLVTREDPSGTYPGTLWPEQAIGLEEAIAAFTINGAEAMGLGAETGSLTVGKSADFVVLNRDPFAHPATELVQTVVAETWFSGRRVYAAEQA
ncbi:amidohydrolase [Leucobacter chromiireducens]|uniref:Amidohydrolase n=1 Tax=Leucobacter chromiireducens subsp. solipictus TaxID=398235 RepID=A0ABS1SHJ6_9MICO|nr:amidohydrolase [Leucobacter chromiireducens]MBL3680033.1 amidohydrolase [Leucobacter chromiireducens subsp. solipictus]